MARVLVADDDPALLLALTARLRSLGHDVVVTGDGTSVLSVAREQHPDLILLDVSMPGLSGTETTRQLKSHPDTADIPVLLMTGSEAPEHFDDALRYGATAYLAKPFADGSIESMIDAALAEEVCGGNGLALWRLHRPCGDANLNDPPPPAR